MSVVYGVEILVNTIDMKKSESLIKKCTTIFLVIFVIGVFLGDYKVVGRLAISNVLQVISLLFLIPAISKVFTLKDILVYIGMILSLFITDYFVFLWFGITPKYIYLAFFSLMIFVLQYFILLAKKNVYYTFFLEVMKKLLFFVLIYFIIYASYEFVVQHHQYLRLGFDDKTHACILSAFFAFFSLKESSGVSKYIYSFTFMLLSLLTISRLSIIFLALFVLAIATSFSDFMTIIRRNDDGYGIARFYLGILSLLIVVCITAFLFIKNYSSFGVFNRVSSGSSGSTQGHMLLIKYGVRAKFTNIGTFLLGIGPGDFASFVTRINSTVDTSEFARTDPTGFAALCRGTMPMHSVHFSIFSEFPLIIFLAYVWLNIKIIYSLVKGRLNIDLLFFVAFTTSITFYSSHDELFYYLIMIYLIMISFSEKISLDLKK